MTPGKYLRLRREAAGLSIDDVALMTETDPYVCARQRGEYLRDIEAGTMKLGKGVTLQLTPFAAQQRFPFDPQILAELVAIENEEAFDQPRLCRRCARSWNEECADPAGAPWLWSDDDAPLCSTCVVAEAEASFAPLPASTTPSPAA